MMTWFLQKVTGLYIPSFIYLFLCLFSQVFLKDPDTGVRKDIKKLTNSSIPYERKLLDCRSHLAFKHLGSLYTNWKKNLLMEILSRTPGLFHPVWEEKQTKDYNRDWKKSKISELFGWDFWFSKHRI